MQGQADMKNFNLSEILGADADSSKSKDLLFLKKKLEKIKFAIDNLENMEGQQKKIEQEKLNEIKEDLINRIEEQISAAKSSLENEVSHTFAGFSDKMKGLLQEIRSLPIDPEGRSSDVSKKPNKVYSEKTFSHHDSMLTVLFRSKEEFKTLYHLALASMILLMFNLVFTDYIETGQFISMETLYWCFVNIESVIKAWVIMITYSFSVILLIQMIKTFNLGKRIWIPLYCLYMSFFYVYSSYITIKHELNFGSAMIILCESTRVSLKVHSYFRNKMLYGMPPNPFAKYLPPEAIQRGLTEKDICIPGITIESISVEIGRYLYFLMCPTLVYRDEYPKRGNRNLNFILFNGFNCFLCIYYLFILFKTFIKPEFSHSGDKPGNLRDFLTSIFRSILPGTFCLFLLFYGLLHSWFNFWAEIFRFPDRLFYEDWWNSLEFGTYYRKWNIVVHEFLYYYVYMDLLKFSKGKLSRSTSQLLTFLISAVIHEWILTYAIGFFYPMLFILFTGPGIFLIRNTRNQKSKQLNIAFWILLFFGDGLLMVLYFREFYARATVDLATVQDTYGWLGIFMPRTLYVFLHPKN